jgi:hypothetical protein
MKFKNYCIVILGNTLDVLVEIQMISEFEPSTLEAKGLFISTFTSSFSTYELTTLFIDNKRSFLLFDLDKENSGFNFIDKKIQNNLFELTKSVNLEELNKKYLKIIEHQGDVDKAIDMLLILKDVNNMSKLEKEKIINEYLDNGIEKLNDFEKKLLSLLAK